MNEDKPWFTVSNNLIILSIIATIVSYFSPEIIWYGMHGNSLVWTIDYKTLALQFIMYQFLHWGIMHLLSNWLFLYLFGNIVENELWIKKYLLFFLGNTIFVWIAIILFSKWNTIWISWFTMAILWYYLLHLKKNKNPEYASAWILLLINIYAWIWTNISFIWHLSWAMFWLIYFYLINLIRKKI